MIVNLIRANVFFDKRDRRPMIWSVKFGMDFGDTCQGVTCHDTNTMVRESNAKHKAMGVVTLPTLLTYRPGIYPAPYQVTKVELD